MKKSMSKSSSNQKNDKQDQAPKGNKKIHIAVTILMYLIAIAIIYFSYTHYSTIKTNLLFNDAKVKKVDNQIKFLIEIGFWLSIYLFVNWVGVFLLNTFGRGENCSICKAVRRNLNNTFQQSVIFLGIFSYCLVTANVGYKKKEFVLLANWFVISRAIYGVLSLIDGKLNWNLRELGSALGFFTILAMLSAVAGQNLFDHI